ncbi:type 1 glutamine amidotransferase [Jannaschia ovalis]|uniref:Type 1 glutamine amidotransferase n=1 Tax=Jannaschia ovalis TaxID=3038773 RepID=A0ABY8LHV6_9RHOB|nr:type 1 glutamine amidotransferase [Jannaschia sp. GRR-S6-38]WGH79745.1 type 1 glutamine amidotransferase [Jannaschia sp. GRR-S6-38]
MKIGILMAGHTSAEIAARHGDFDAMFRRLLDGHGFTFETWDVEGMDFPDAPSAADGWLVSGSKHGAYEDHAFIPPLEAFIRDVHAARVPLAGICFGHQIVAQALGGAVVKHPDGWALGHSRYALPGGEEIALNAWHQDQVVALPPGARVLASNAFCPVAAMAVGDHVLTVQAHPEFSNAVLDDYVRTRRGTGSYPEDRMDAAADTSRPIDDARLGRAIADFFKTGVPHV